MAFDVSALTNYVREKEGVFLTSLLFKPATADLIDQKGIVQMGVKSTEKINIMDTDAVFQTGGTCGFSASGTTTFTQRDLVPGKIKVHESICPKDLETKYTQKFLRAGSQYTEVDFAEDYVGKKLARINAQLETAIWQSDTASSNVNLNKFDGFLKQARAASATVVNANATAFYGTPVTGGLAALNATAIINVVDSAYRAIPVDIIDRDDVYMFIGWDAFRQYSVALKNQNYFDAAYRDGLANGEVYVPNTNVKLKAVPGLNGSDAVITTYAGNMVMGVDVINEEDKIDLFFAKEADQIRFMAEWKYCVNFAFPQHVVTFFAR
jgi:hypothetical protein